MSAAFLLALAGCRMSHLESAKQQADPGQEAHTAAQPATGEQEESPGQPDKTPLASATDGSLALTIAGASAAESDGVLRFTVTLSRAAGAPVSVHYETADGSARAGTDYVPVSGRLTFPAESTVAQQIEVPLRNDQVGESRETLTVALDGPQGAVLAVATATGTILDDDARALALQPSVLFVTEGQGAGYAVSLGSRPTGDVTVTVTAAAELTVTPARLLFTPARWSEAREVTLTARQDSDGLADAPVELAHTANGGGYDGVASATLTVTIVEDDVPTLAVAAARASEQERRIRFEVTLSQASDGVVSVDYATGSSGDTATEGEDYSPASGTLRFPSRSTAAQAIEVTVNDDGLHESTEQFTVTLRNAHNAALAGGGDSVTAPGSIEDQDTPPEMSIDSARLAEGSGDGSMRFRVRLDPASGQTVTVRYATANVTATAGTDYTEVSGTLTFGAGATVRTVAVPIADDALDEPDGEQFAITLQAAVHATLSAARGIGTGTIEDNDPQPALSVADGALTEGAGGAAMRFAVRLAPASGRTVTAQYGTADVTAAAGADYTAVSGTLTLRAGATVATIAVPILDDTAEEQSETFSVTLRAPAGAALADATATGTIADDGDRTYRSAVGGGNSTALALASLLVTGGDGTMYPAFDADILHYALSCNDSTTLSITAQALRSGAQLTLLRTETDDNVVATGTLEVEVTVDGDHDVAVELSDGGDTTTYVVHCLPAAFPDIVILAKTDQVKDGLLLVAPTYGAYSTNTTYLAILDNNGVPRFHRLLATARADDEFWALDFKAHGNGNFSVSRRPAYDLGDSDFGNWEIDLLNERFEVTSTVRTVAPLSQTDGHDFHIAPNGDYVMLSYYTDPDGRDFSEYGGSDTQTTRDSVIQRRTADGVSRFTWNSWDHRDVLRVGNDCRVGLYPDTYAHLNALQLLADGDYVASFRGLCAGVADRRIDRHGGVEARRQRAAGGLRYAIPGDGRCRGDRRRVLRTAPGHADLVRHGGHVRQWGAVCGRPDDRHKILACRGIRHFIRYPGNAACVNTACRPATVTSPTKAGVSVLDSFDGSVHWLITWGTKGNTRSGTVTAQEAIAISEVDPATGSAHLHINMTKGDEQVRTYRAYRVPERDVSIPLNLP